jgi:tetratricopeptide (TPR) repeat protein
VGDWRAGSKPRIEDYLKQVEGPERPALLRELLLEELDLRRADGQRPSAREYRRRFPAHGDLVGVAFGETTGEVDRGEAVRPDGDPGRNLLFGILALQNNFIGRDDLLAAFAAWVADKSRPLAQVLGDRGALDGARRALLEALAAEHLKHHGGDTGASLAAVSSLGSVREDLERLGDTGLHASLAAAASLPAWSGDDSGVSTADLPSSRRAGVRFRILRFHREGGLGRVHVARDEELGRDVALKEIRPDKAAEADLRGRFVLEAEINGGLEHPGIVPVYSLGTYADGRPFYAMRFVEGDSLKEAIEAYHNAHPRPDPTAVEFRRLLGRFVDVCEAIAFAHSKGVLHRDLKPHNVMLGRYGETLLIDWGLAKATGRREPAGAADAREATLVPPSGSGHEPTLGVIGSPPYMSPEQAAGEVEAFGPATDVYGLGAILFALLTGEPPVEGTTTEEVLDRARRGLVRSPWALNPRVPRALEAVCLKALAPKPGGRYPTAQALAEDVERWTADEPVSAWREPFTRRAGRWARRHRTAVAGVAVAVLAGLIGLAAVATVQTRARARLADANTRLAEANGRLRAALDRESSANAATARALVRAREEADKAEAVNDFLTEDLLSQAEPQHNAVEDRVTLREVLDRAAAKVGDRFANKPEVEEAVRRTIAGTYHGLASWPESERQWRAVLDSARRRHGPDSAEALVAQRQVAHVLLHRGRPREALALIEPSATGLARALGPDHPETLASRADLADAYSAAGRIAEAVRLLESVAKAWESKQGPGDRDTITSRYNLAKAYHTAGRNAEAVGLFEAVVKADESMLGPDHPETLVSRNELATSYLDTGRIADAVELLEAVLKASLPKLGPDHLYTLQTRNALAVAYRAAGRPAKAIEILEPVAKSIEVKLGSDHPETLTCRHNLASAYLNAGRPAEAIGLLEAVSQARESALGPDDRGTLTSRAQLGVAYWQEGRFDRSVPLFEETYRRMRAKFGPDHPNTLVTLTNLGVNCCDAGRPAEGARLMQEALDRARGRPDAETLLAGLLPRLAAAYEANGEPGRAEPLYRAALERARGQFGPDDPRTAEALAQLGGALLQQEKCSEAEPVLRACLAVREKTQPDTWNTFNTRSLLGGALLGRGRYPEAEPLVVSGYEGMEARAATIPPEGRPRSSIPASPAQWAVRAATIPPEGRPRLAEAALRVIRLYEAWGKPGQATAWKEKLGLADLPADVFAPLKRGVGTGPGHE